MLTIKDTTGQDTITCINYDNTTILVSGLTSSIIERLCANADMGISTIEFQLLDKEIQANINPNSYKFHIVPGSSFYVNTLSSDITYNGQPVSNVFVAKGYV